MNKIIYVGKKEGYLSTPEMVTIFENSEDMGEIKSAVNRTEDRIYLSWASVEARDLAGELIPIEDVISQQQTLIERNGPITDEHSNRVVGQTIAYKVMEHPKSGTMGVLHLNRIFDHNEIDDTVWSEIVSGERKGSSVGGYNTDMSFKREEDGENTKVLEDFHQFETASVREPCNPLALNEAFSVVAKSAVSKAEYQGRKVELNKPFRLSGEEKKFGVYVQNGDKVKLVKFGDSDMEIKRDDKEARENFRSRHSCNEKNDKTTPGYWSCRMWDDDVTVSELLEKQYENYVTKPAKLDRCVEGIMSDPEFKPTDGRSKEESAYAICTAQLEKSVTNIKNKNSEQTMESSNTTKTGDNMTEDNVEKSTLSEISETLKGIDARLSKLEKAEEEEKEEETMKEDEMEEEKGYKKKEMEEEEDPVEKENASSDIEGSKGKETPETPVVEDSNDKDVYKAEISELKKSIEELKKGQVVKAETPHPGSYSEVQKKVSGLAMDIATGKKRMPWAEVHKTVQEME